MTRIAFVIAMLWFVWFVTTTTIREISGIFKGIPDKVSLFEDYENRLKDYHENFDAIYDDPKLHKQNEQSRIYFEYKVAHYMTEILRKLERNNQL